MYSKPIMAHFAELALIAVALFISLYDLTAFSTSVLMAWSLFILVYAAIAPAKALVLVIVSKGPRPAAGGITAAVMESLP